MITHQFYDVLPNAAANIRTRVFVQEQGFREEFDTVDRDAVHLVVSVDGVPAATGRAYREGDAAHIGRVAVLPEYRVRHLGSTVMQLLEQRLRDDGCRTVAVSAQCRARGFYEKCGYAAVGDVYLDEHCPHIKMTKTL